jgi:hypothetical protein
MLGQALDFSFDCRINFSQNSLLCIFDDFELRPSVVVYLFMRRANIEIPTMIRIAGHHFPMISPIDILAIPRLFIRNIPPSAIRTTPPILPIMLSLPDEKTQIPVKPKFPPTKIYAILPFYATKS